MKLYFKHSNGAQDYLCDVDSVDSGVGMALKDLRVRAPHFKSYYQRVWQEDDGTTWVDVGSWSEYYVIKVD